MSNNLQNKQPERRVGENQNVDDKASGVSKDAIAFFHKTQFSIGTDHSYSKQKHDSRPTSADWELKRTWPTTDSPSHQKSKPSPVNHSSAIDRWQNENMTEQPYHGIERVPGLSSRKGEFASRGKMSSNRAVAGSGRSS